MFYVPASPPKHENGAQINILLAAKKQNQQIALNYWKVGAGSEDTVTVYLSRDSRSHYRRTRCQELDFQKIWKE